MKQPEMETNMNNHQTTPATPEQKPKPPRGWHIFERLYSLPMVTMVTCGVIILLVPFVYMAMGMNPLSFGAVVAMALPLILMLVAARAQKRSNDDEEFYSNR
jgi:Flp pilus assembly protein TadB